LFPPPAAPSTGPEMRHFTKKIILIGDGGVGKTTLIRKFVYDMFDDKYIATIGTKVSKKKVVISDIQLDINLMVWDVQGQRNDPLLTRYFTGAEGALFVCDVTRFQTFENLPEWIKDFESVCGKVPMIILGNKSDLVDNSQFGESELSALAARYSAKSFLTSAKTGANVESSFKDLARSIMK
jgi:small GTP-binding protein